MIPNSTNIFETYKSYVESADSLAKIIMDSKINRSTIRAIRRSIRHLSVLADDIAQMFTHLDQVSNISVKAENIQNIKTIVDDAVGIYVTLAEHRKLVSDSDKIVDMFVNGLESLVDKIGELSKKTNKRQKSIANLRNYVAEIKDLAHDLSDTAKQMLIAAGLIGATVMVFTAVGILTVKMFGYIAAGMLAMLVIVEYMKLLSKIASENKKAIDSLKSIAKAVAWLGVVVISLVATGMLIISGIVAIGAAIVILPIIMIWLGAISLIGDLLHDSNTFSVIRDISRAIMMLSATTVILILTGFIILKGFKLILISMTYLSIVIGMFALIGHSRKIVFEGSQVFMHIAATFLLLSASVVLLALTGNFIQANWEQLLKVGMLIVGVIAAFALLAFVARKIDKGVKEMLIIAATMIVLSLVAVLLGVTGRYIDSNWEQIGKVLALLGGIALAFVAVGYASSQIKKGAATVLVLIIPLAAAVAAIWLIKEITDDADMSKLWQGYGMMMAIIGGFAAVAIGMGAIGIMALAGAAVMIALTYPIIKIAQSMMMIAVTMKMLSDLNLDEKALFEKMRIPLSVTEQIIEQVDKIGLIKVTSAAYKMSQLSRITISIGRMADVMQQVSSLKIPVAFDDKGNPKEWKIMEHDDFVGAAINSGTIASFFVNLFSKGEGSIMYYDGKSERVVDIPKIDLDDLKGIGLKAVYRMKSLQFIVEAVGGMAETLQLVSSLAIPDAWNKDGKPTHYRKMEDDEFASASTNVARIMTTLLEAVTDDELETKLKRMSLLAAAKVKMIMESGGSITPIVNTVFQLASGMWPTKFDEKGNPTDYLDIKTVLSPTAQSDLSAKLSGLLGVFVNAVASEEIAKRGRAKGFLGLGGNSDIKNAKKVITGIEEVIDPITKIIDAVVKLNKDIPNSADDIKEKITGVITGLTDPIFNMGDARIAKVKERVPTIKSIMDIFDKRDFNDSTTKNLEKSTKAASDLLVQVNKTDLGKLKQAQTLFARLAQFSKSISGNFDKLADCINEKLITALEELKNVLEGVTMPTTTVPVSVPMSIIPNNQKEKPEVQKPQFTEADINKIKNALDQITGALSSSGGRPSFRVSSTR